MRGEMSAIGAPGLGSDVLLLVLITLLMFGLNAEAQPFRPSPTPIWRAEDRLVLEALYTSTNGNAWKKRTGWRSEESLCEWYGISCGSEWIDGRERSVVKAINLSYNGLRGSLPPAITSLKYLNRLDVAGNDLSGPVPEAILDRWDRNDFDFSGEGNSFSNLLARVRVNSSVVGTLCADDDDVAFQLDVQESGAAVFQTVRCTKGTERGTHCLVREGRAPGLHRLSRALKSLGFHDFLARYSSPFHDITHGKFLTTSVWMGDGSLKSVETYGDDEPIRVWTAQQLFLNLLAELEWQREYEKPECQMSEASND